MQVLTEQNRLGDILKFESGDVKRFSREDVTVLSGQELAVGAVIGKITKGACPATGTADAGNSGAGTCSAVSAGAQAQVGTYAVMPGDQVKGATSGASGRVQSLSLSTGSWAGGDAAGTLILDDVTGTFQSENINVEDNANVATIGGNASNYYPDRPGVAVVRDAEINAGNLVWPAGATSDQKAAALVRLAERGIVSRPIA
ncbi:MAG: head decoration protein [Desulfobacteraceae bacterium]|nr:head decoration protein [Desulfobacteraceae bacterium]